jgi:hypothetical protein
VRHAIFLAIARDPKVKIRIGQLMEMIYEYLTGPKFRLRVQAIVDAFTNMAEDLHKEKKVMMKHWAKREEEITRVMGATVGMYGELQGIAGKTLKEIEGLELKALDDAPNPRLGDT